MTRPVAADVCAYCGLPAPTPLWQRRQEAAEPAYCCYGCRFAAAVAGASGAEGQTRWQLTRLGIAVFFAMNVMAFTMALWTQDVYAPEDPSRLSATLFGLFRYLCLFFTLPVLLLLGGPLADNAFAGLKRGYLSTDLLLLAGVVAACAVSVNSVLRDEGPIYFEIACAVLVLVTLGRWLEARGKLQASEAIEALTRLLPEAVRVVQAAGEKSKRRADVLPGERVHVLAGERIPCDGVVLHHAATVDEQLLTGESAETTKEPGDPIYAGTLNLDSDLVFEVRVAAADDALARLVQFMREAQRAQGPYERLAERLARFFLPAVVLIALVTATVHCWQHGIDQGILAGLAVLLIACPCALGVATPLAVWAALGRAAQHGVLFRSGEVLERLATIRVIAFDKTGTLTTGSPRLASWSCAAGTPVDDIWRHTRAMASASTHGLARALMATTIEPSQVPRGEFFPSGSGSKDLAQVQTLPGRGLQALDVHSGEVLLLGSPRLMEEQHQAWPDALRTEAEAAQLAGQPLTAVAWTNQVRGLFLFEETLRAEAVAVVRRLQNQGLTVHILTGDHRQRGRQLAQALGVAAEAELLPQNKLTILQKLRQQGPVAMVGDGINDGPALAASDVGIALSCGADVARAAAGVCLQGDDLRNIPWAVSLARRTVRVIRQNLFWAVAYNVLGIGLACTGRLNPVWAALAMILSGGVVLVNSLRLTRDDVAEASSCSMRS